MNNQEAMRQIYLAGQRTLVEAILSERGESKKSIDEYLKPEISGQNPTVDGFDRWMREKH